MKHILLIGAGRSTAYFIRYFGDRKLEGYHLTIADHLLELALEQCQYSNCKAMALNVFDTDLLDRTIHSHDLVVSMLPAHMHHHVAQRCILQQKPLITASYLSEEIMQLEQDVKDAGIFILGEMGVDPGIDHMSAMKIIDNIRSKGGEISAFESFTGGLPAPRSEDNPWKYKFTWNPRNVVLAGQGGAVKFIQEGQYKYIPYHKLFRRTEIIEIPEFGQFEGYANRDSLKYREVYGLQDIKTMYRGTLRRPGFCRAWNCFVELGITDDSFKLDDSENMSARDLLNTFLAYNPNDSVELKLRQYLKIDQDDTAIWQKLEWLGLFSNKKLGLKNASPAQMLQHILEEKWKMAPHDRDMIVMWHLFKYRLENQDFELKSSMVCLGEDSKMTAMAKTVGLPMAIFCKNYLEGRIQGPLTGCLRPIAPFIYEPVLNELSDFNITFKEFIETES